MIRGDDSELGGSGRKSTWETVRGDGFRGACTEWIRSLIFGSRMVSGRSGGWRGIGGISEIELRDRESRGGFPEGDAVENSWNGSERVVFGQLFLNRIKNCTAMQKGWWDRFRQGIICEWFGGMIHKLGGEWWKGAHWELSGGGFQGDVLNWQTICFREMILDDSGGWSGIRGERRRYTKWGSMQTSGGLFRVPFVWLAAERALKDAFSAVFLLFLRGNRNIFLKLIWQIVYWCYISGYSPQGWGDVRKIGSEKLKKLRIKIWQNPNWCYIKLHAPRIGDDL